MKIYLLFLAGVTRGIGRAFVNAKYNFGVRRLAAKQEQEAREFTRWMIDMQLRWLRWEV